MPGSLYNRIAAESDSSINSVNTGKLDRRSEFRIANERNEYTKTHRDEIKKMASLIAKTGVFYKVDFDN